MKNQPSTTQKKNKGSMALLRLEIGQEECRGLLMGHIIPYVRIYDIVFEKDNEVSIHTFENSHLESSMGLKHFSIIHYCDSEYIITGRNDLQ